MPHIGHDFAHGLGFGGICAISAQCGTWAVPVHTAVRTFHGVSLSLQLLQGFSARCLLGRCVLAVLDAAPGVSVGHTAPGCSLCVVPKEMQLPCCPQPQCPLPCWGLSCSCLPSLLEHRGLSRGTPGFPECPAPSCRAAAPLSQPWWGCACPGAAQQSLAGPGSSSCRPGLPAVPPLAAQEQEQPLVQGSSCGVGKPCRCLTRAGRGH